eukprot:scaffold78762_cov72-Phaeocystis_antarctica.AAC.1
MAMPVAHPYAVRPAARATPTAAAHHRALRSLHPLRRPYPRPRRCAHGGPCLHRMHSGLCDATDRHGQTKPRVRAPKGDAREAWLHHRLGRASKAEWRGPRAHA